MTRNHVNIIFFNIYLRTQLSDQRHGEEGNKEASELFKGWLMVEMTNK